jgi:hypothetical protein
MKKFSYLMVLVLVQVTSHSQETLRDGIYRIDHLSANRLSLPRGRTIIEFNPLFVDEEPEKYDPIVICTDDFVPLELADLPVIQPQNDRENILLVQLTGKATKKLSGFTTKNIMNQVVVVVNGEALVIYKIVAPVNGSFIKLAPCSTQGCSLIYRSLKCTVIPYRS